MCGLANGKRLWYHIRTQIEDRKRFTREYPDAAFEFRILLLLT